jgi:penicillin-binding protein 2
MARLLFLRAIVLLVVVVLVGRLYQLQLVQDEAQAYNQTFSINTTRWQTLAPMRGEIFAADGTTKLAESIPIYTVAAYPADIPPPASFARAKVFAQLSELLALSATLTLSPSSALDTRPGLRQMLGDTLGPSALTPSAGPPLTSSLTLSVAPSQTLQLASLSFAFSDVLQLQTYMDQVIAPADAEQVPNWQTLTIKEDVPREMALVIWENAAGLPGIVVEEDYRRRYPQSGTVPSVSHLLGYIGRIDECELVLNNPAPTWVDGLLGSMRHAVDCGILAKPYDQRAVAPRYLNDDRIGKDGVEFLFERELRGQVGLQSLLVDALDHPLGPPQSYEQARTGNSLVLTLDLNFQQQTEAILRKWLAEADRRRANAGGQFAYKQRYEPISNGVAIALDPRSGKLLASVSLPSYDNNIWVDTTRANELTAILAPSPEALNETRRLAVLTNRAISGEYPPGSTLKQFVGSIALQNQVIAPDSRLHDPGELLVRDRYVAERVFRYPNSVPGDRGEVTVSDALLYSSNVFFMSIAGGNNDQVINLGDDDPRTDGLRERRLVEGLQWFGLGDETGLAPKLESRGRVPTPGWKQRILRETWTTGDTYNMAIGQGNLLVTPLQLVNGASAIANNGTLYRPYLVQSVLSPSGELVIQTTPSVVRTVPVDPGYLAVVREGMRRSVSEGVNVAARDACSGLLIAGKTGTAEYSQIIPETGMQRSHAWFVGFAPYDNPEIAVVVLIEGAGDLDDGSATLAVPAVTEIMQAYFGVAPPAERPLTCPPLP